MQLLCKILNNNFKKQIYYKLDLMEKNNSPPKLINKNEITLNMKKIIIKQNCDTKKFKQIFKKFPNISFSENVFECFNINIYHPNLERINFTKKDLEKHKTLEKITELIPKLKTIYLNCKHFFLENLTIKKCFTILRHFLKFYNFELLYKEGYLEKKKIIIYRIKSPIIKKEPSLILYFE
jgi:hypothetical protein